MSGSLSLIIVLIVVVWAIVLAPMVFGDSKPIRRSGEGYDETRVLHRGGTAPVQVRRKPRVTAADVQRVEKQRDHEFARAAQSGRLEQSDDVDGLNGLDPLGPETVDAAELSLGELVNATDNEERDKGVVDGNGGRRGGSTRVTFSGGDASGEYDVDDSYFSPEDFGYTSSAVVSVPAEDELPQEVAGADTPVDAAAQSIETQVEEVTDPPTADETPGEIQDDIPHETAIARARRGRGGWDPDVARRAHAERSRRRQRTVTSLIAITAVAIVVAAIAGGWAWSAPIITAGLLAWYLTALRNLVKQERALHARRVRQLHRARLGVVSAEQGAPLPAHMRRPGAVIVEMDDESADFTHLPVRRGPQPWTADNTDEDLGREYAGRTDRVREIA